MLNKILPKKIMELLESNFNENEINEIRIRVNMPIVVFCGNKTYVMCDCGNLSSGGREVIGTYEMVEEVVFRASEYSIYANNEQIKNGYIVLDDGTRVGLCGDVVGENGVVTIRDFSSVCIRVPHNIKDCSLPIFDIIYDGVVVNSTLIVSPPGAGKTTMLKDLIYQFSIRKLKYNIFIADERGEISGGIKNMYVNNCDYLCYLNKKNAIMYGLRSMSPDIVVTDELGTESDFEAVEYASCCGVSVFATIHAKDVNDIKNKKKIMSMIDKKLIERIVVLSNRNGVGTIESVYNNNLISIYGGAMWNCFFVLLLFLCLD